MSKMTGFQLGVILLYALCLSTQVVSQTSPMAMSSTSASNPNSTMMTTNSYSGNNTNTTVTGGATGSLHVGLSSLLPSVMVVVSFLHRFC